MVRKTPRVRAAERERVGWWMGRFGLVGGEVVAGRWWGMWRWRGGFVGSEVDRDWGIGLLDMRAWR